jgi:hypothetical protein
MRFRRRAVGEGESDMNRSLDLVCERLEVRAQVADVIWHDAPDEGCDLVGDQLLEMSANIFVRHRHTQTPLARSATIQPRCDNDATASGLRSTGGRATVARAPDAAAKSRPHNAFIDSFGAALPAGLAKISNSGDT